MTGLETSRHRTSKTENLDGSFSYMGWKDKDGMVQGKAMTVEYRYTGNQKFVRLVQEAELKKTPPAVKRESFGEQKIDFAPSGEIIRGEFKIEGTDYTVLEDDAGNLTATYKDENGMGRMAMVDMSQDGARTNLTSVRADGKATRVTLEKGADTDRLILSEGQRTITESGEENLVVTSLYDRAGRLIGASGYGESVSDDGFGNKSFSTIMQNFAVVAGQAKMASVTTRTDIVNIDGSHSVRDGAVDSVVSYFYSAQGNLLRAENTVPGVTVMDDGFGNRSASKTTQNYDVINGQAKVKSVSTHTDVVNIDGSHSVAAGSVDSVVTYTYGTDPDGRRGVLIRSENTTPGVTVMDDGFGNISKSTTRQTYDIINGQAKVKTVTTSTEINNIDGSFSVADQSVSSVVTYDYGDRGGKKGILTGARNTQDGVTAVNDGFGNISKSVTHQTYDIINGQAKVKTVATSSEINNIDGSFSIKDQSVSSEVTYDYGDKDGKKGILTGARNTRDGVTAVNDGFGNISKSVTHQTYDIINGQAKVKTVTSSSEINNIDGSFSVADQSVASVVTYDYGDKDGKKGILTGARNTRDGVTAVNDGFGNISKSVTHQTYELINGQAKVKTVTTSTEIANIDGSFSVKDQSVSSEVTYDYGDKDGKKGILTGARNTRDGVTAVNDGFGNISKSVTHQTYELINGQAKVKTVTTSTE
ncbi:MAG: hypothetical protein HYY63_03085, partial [Elusimicrobia bacterium]|nr:hypothetical protein [Elusimicrobiota bacterium]